MNIGVCGIIVGGMDRFLIRLSYTDSNSFPNLVSSSCFLEFLRERIYFLSSFNSLLTSLMPFANLVS